jgi:hypothetical protein
MEMFGWLKKTNTGTAIEALIKAPLPALPPVSAQSPVSPGPERFVLNCVCAVVDQGYQLIFVRQPSGRLRYVESVKLTGEARAGSANARAAASQTIPMADLRKDTGLVRGAVMAVSASAIAAWSAKDGWLAISFAAAIAAERHGGAFRWIRSRPAMNRRARQVQRFPEVLHCQPTREEVVMDNDDRNLPPSGKYR